MKTFTVTVSDDPESSDESSLRRAVNADGAFGALYDIKTEIFRPARKHGYGDGQISTLLKMIEEKFPATESETDAGSALIGLLEDEFIRILQDHGVDLDRDYR